MRKLTAVPCDTSEPQYVNILIITGKRFEVLELVHVMRWRIPMVA